MPPWQEASTSMHILVVLAYSIHRHTVHVILVFALEPPPAAVWRAAQVARTWHEGQVQLWRQLSCQPPGIKLLFVASRNQCEVRQYDTANQMTLEVVSNLRVAEKLLAEPLSDHNDSANCSNSLNSATHGGKAPLAKAHLQATSKCSTGWFSANKM